MSRKAKIAVLILAAVVTTIATIFFIRNIRHKQDKPRREILRDSIKHFQQQAKVHGDSADIAKKKSDEYKIKYNDYLRADAAFRDSLRARYRSNLREKIRTKPSGFVDSLRADEADPL